MSDGVIQIDIPLRTEVDYYMTGKIINKEMPGYCTCEFKPIVFY